VAVTNRINKTTALSALTLSATAISSGAQAMAVPEKKQVSVRVTNYQEQPLPETRLAGGSTERYGINVLQFSYFTPVAGQYSVMTTAQYEKLSGASPYGSAENADGQTEVLMSGATIDEQRLDASVTGTRYFKSGTLASGLAVSTENDYQSVALSLDGSLEIFDKHTTLMASVSTSFDSLSPTGPKIGTRAEADGETKRSVSWYEGVTQVIDKYSTVQVGVGYTRLWGYLSDPYKGDSRPDSREQYTVSAQYRRFLSDFDSALHLDYRLYQDDWGVISNTLSGSTWTDVNVFGQRIMLSPNVRYYWQHAADFYTVKATTDEHFSSDYRLSAYGAINFGLDAQWHHKDYVYTIGVNQYLSAESWGLTGGQDTETPSLVNFTTISFGVDYKFK